MDRPALLLLETNLTLRYAGITGSVPAGCLVIFSRLEIYYLLEAFFRVS